MSSQNTGSQDAAARRRDADRMGQEGAMARPAGLASSPAACAAAGNPVCAVSPDAANDRRQAEGARQQSEERFRVVADLAPVGIYLCTPDGLCSYVNPRWCEMAGLSPEEALGDGWARGLHPDDRDTVLSSWQRMVAARGTWGLEYRFMTPAGKVTWVYGTATAQCDAQGTVLGYIGVNTDITERKKAEEELAASEAKRRRLFETMSEGVFYQRADGLLVDVNDAALRMFGLTREEFLSRTSMHSEWDVIREDGTPLPGPEHPSMQALSTGKPVQDLIVGILNPQTKAYTWVSVSAVPEFRDGEAAPWQVVVTLHDFSAHRRADEERAKLEAQLQHAQKLESVGRLAGGVAHEFNNLLMGILNYVELCRDELPPEHPVRNYLDEISADAQRSADITRQLLAFARRQIVAPTVLDLNDAMAGMLKILQRLMGEDITLTWRPGANLWPVMMDASQLGQILVTLCVNVRDAIAGVGKVAIATANASVDDAYCAAHPDAVPGEYVRLTVSDNGCGMSKDVLEHIFEPFFTTKAVGEGTGLGLATVYGIVRQNNGHVCVTSEPAQGTTFSIYLPRASSAPEPEPTPPAPTSGNLPRGTETVLLAEDEKSVRVTSRLFLEQLGYTVLVAGTPGEAESLARAHSGPIHLLLCDVVMPDMNGRDLAARLTEQRPGLQCLFMSGYAASVIMRRGMLDAAMQFIPKPFTRADLARKVREVLDRRPEATAPP